MSLTTYNFYNKDWFIAADVVKHYKLSSNYNTYYSKYYSNGRLYGPVASFEFRLSGEYLNQFKALYGADKPALIKSSAVWLIDEETVRKLINKEIINSKEKTVKTVESNGLSIQYNLGVDKNEANKHATPNIPYASTILDGITNDKIAEDNNRVKQDFTFTCKPVEQLTRDEITVSTINSITIEELSKKMSEDRQKLALTVGGGQNLPFPLSMGSSTITSTIPTYSTYSEEDISDAITLISSKLTNSPYQQEKILDGGSIRLDLFTCTRRSVYAIELKKNTITLEHVKEKLDNKSYLKHIMDAYPDLNITFIFSSPKGITFDALMYLQEASKSIGEHRVIYKPTSNLLLDMINKKEKDLPSYYYKQILDKPIIKYLLQVN